MPASPSARPPPKKKTRRWVLDFVRPRDRLALADFFRLAVDPAEAFRPSAFFGAPVAFAFAEARPRPFAPDGWPFALLLSPLPALLRLLP